MTATSSAAGATITTTTATITPPSSSHGLQPAWEYDRESARKYDSYANVEKNGRHALASQNGNYHYDPYSVEEYSATKGPQKSDRSRSVPDNRRQHADSVASTAGMSSEDQWIHRDKLAKIESEELQAAGFVLPKARAPSRPRRERSQDKINGQRRATDASDASYVRSRKNSTQSELTPDVETPAWDLRLPEEIAEDPGEYFSPNESGKGSRIPVAKASPAPIPVDYLERDAPFSRKPSHGTLLDEDGSFSLSKSRSRSGSVQAFDDPARIGSAKRSVTEGSPKKIVGNGMRKTSAPSKPTSSNGRPKTSSGSKTRSTSSTRPTTRSGESAPRAPEGDPPWLMSAYTPDPRLPPDQQLLPTVARRLQQEKWEQEGKFGNVYDKDFRPLNEEPSLKPPELEKPKDVEQRQDEWPLRADAKSPTPSRPGTSSYSTMPKIQDKPATSPLTSPRPIQQPNTHDAVVRIPEPPEEPQEKKKEKGGCGCCLVM